MLLIRPKIVNDASLLSSNIAETAPNIWQSTATYAAGDLVRPASGTAVIANHVNTTVTALGGGVYSVQKTSGADGYNADAVSAVGISGDFVLRIKHLSNSVTPNAYLAGLNTDPLTDSNYTSIDRAWVRNETAGQWQIYENGALILGNVVDATYCWIWRSGATIYYGRGATLAVAQVAPDYVVTDSSTLYFDSSFYSTGGSFEALLSYASASPNAPVPTYRSLQDGNVGNDPASSPAWWGAAGDVYQLWASTAVYAAGDRARVAAGSLDLNFAARTYQSSGASYGVTQLPGYSYSRTGTVSYYNGTNNPASTIDSFGGDQAPIVSGIGYESYGPLTNSLLYSNQFDNAYWLASHVTITADASVAPDGTTTADKVVPDTVNTGHTVQASGGSGAVVPAGVNTVSVFAKTAGYPRIALRCYDGSAYRVRTTFDVQAGTIILNEAGTAYIINCGNGVYRCVVVSDTMSAASGFAIDVLNSSSVAQGAFNGNGTNGVYLWGAQSLPGVYPDGGPILASGVSAASTGAPVFSLSLPNDAYNAVYTFDDNSQQTIPVTVTAGTFTLATASSLNRPTVKRLQVSPVGTARNGHRVYQSQTGGVSAAVTMTVASPCVVTWNAHGLPANTPILFQTSGSLPTGLTVNTIYYVLAPTANSFNVSATPGGAAINTGGSQSGTQTAIANPNKGIDPASDVGAFWIDTGPTNKWAMFDNYNGTPTADARTIDVTVQASGRVDSLALMSLENAASARVMVGVGGNLADLVASGGFGSGVGGWTPVADTALSTVAGRLRLTEGATGNSAYLSIPVTIGQSYTFSGDSFLGTAANSKIFVGLEAGGVEYAEFDTAGVGQTVSFVATSATVVISLVVDAGLAVPGNYGEFDNISFRTGQVVYDQTFNLLENQDVADWYDFFYEEITKKTKLLVTDLPPYNDPQIRVVLTGTNVACGTMVVGKSKDLGETLHDGAQVGIIDYSRKETDDFGNYTIVPRAFSDTGGFKMRIAKSQVDGIKKVLSDYRATPAVYSASPDYNSTLIFGFFKEFNIEIDYDFWSLCSLEIEGLT